jgi:ribose transport system permease protein
MALETRGSVVEPTSTLERRRRLPLSWLAPRKVGAIYIWIVIIVVFGSIAHGAFLNTSTVTTVLNQYAIAGLIALSAVIPLAAGVFDLSIGYTFGLAGAVTAELLYKTAMPQAVCVLFGVLTGVAVGLFNSLIVVGFRVDPIIGTLGSGFIIGAVTAGVDHNTVISQGVGGSFAHNWAGRSFANVTEPVIYMVALMLILGFAMEQTALGRRWYALGYDFETARLAGVRVRPLRVSALVLSAVVASIAGIAYLAEIGAHSPGDGPNYLLPAFSAVFLGATQIRDGRFNVWGTIIATMMLGTGAYGLLVSGSPPWTIDVFQGSALILAVAVSSLGPGWGRRWVGWPKHFRSSGPPVADATDDEPVPHQE